MLGLVVACLIGLGPAEAILGDPDSGDDFGLYPGYAGPSYRGYTTEALYVTARDGTKLAIDLYLPKGLPAGARIPTIMKVTRYWRAMSLRWPARLFERDEFVEFFTSHGYAVVKKDVRGTGASYGVWRMAYMPEQIQDAGWDVVQWITEQPWSDGTVAAQGISYPGNTAAALPIPNHPAVKAVVPRFIDFDEYTDVPFPGGIVNANFIKLWHQATSALDRNDVPSVIELQGEGLFARLMLRGVKPVDADRDGAMLRAAVAEHAGNPDLTTLATSVTYRDDVPAGLALNIDAVSPHTYREAIERSGAAYYVWGGWTDASTANGVLHYFFSHSNPRRGVIGAWGHGAREDADPFLPADTPVWPSRPDQMIECLRFLDHYLKGVDTGLTAENVLHYYTMGEGAWKTTTVWPPQGNSMQRWYLAEGQGLARTAPASAEGSDEYAVDFTATSGTTNRWYTQLGGADVVYDERPEQVAKMLSYRTEPLAEETEITGHAVVSLRVRSTHDDGAFYVYLDAEAPDGRLIYITDGQLRALHRKISTEPPPYTLFMPYHSFKRVDGAPMTPGRVEEISFGLLPTSVRIPRGYRLRLSIAGHDAENFARYPEQGDPVITVERNRTYASYIDLPIVRLTPRSGG